MKKDEPLVIERVANGYQVKPISGEGMFVCVSEIMVFQLMGYASGPGEGGIRTEDTLLGFLANHFTEGIRHEGTVMQHKIERI